MCCLDLARQTVELLKGIRGATDVSIEQEGPQPQLVIQPDRALCARYNVRIDDVMKLVNMAIGGDPVSTLYEGERRFDIVARLDKRSRTSPEAIGRLPVYTADGVPIPLAQVAAIDGARRPNPHRPRRRPSLHDGPLRHRRARPGRLRPGSAGDASAARSRLPAGYRVEWLGMFENLDRAYKHFMVLIPTTIAIIFLVLVVALRVVPGGAHPAVADSLRFCQRRGGPVPPPHEPQRLDGRRLRHACSASPSWTAFLMFKGISKYRLEGASVDDAIIHGRIDRLRPGLMTSLVAILGLLPAALATSLGSDVQRPLATVIICGLSGSALFTLFITPVFYRIFVPPLARIAARPRRPARTWSSPCPTYPPSKSSGCWSICTGAAARRTSSALPTTPTGSSPAWSTSSRRPRCWASPKLR